MTARTYFLAVIPIAALVTAGCGGCGGDDNSLPDTPITTSTTETAGVLTKDDLLQQGDDICAEVNAAVGTVEESTASASASDRLGQEADLYSGMIERLQSLGNPDDAAGLEDVYTAGDALVQAEQDAQLAAQRGEDTTSAESDAASALASFQDAASAYGFEECGRAPVPPETSSSSTTPVTPVAPVTTTPVAPVTPAPAPAPAPAPSAGTAGGTGGGTSGGGTTGGGTSGGGSSGGIGPG